MRTSPSPSRRSTTNTSVYLALNLSYHYISSSMRVCTRSGVSAQTKKQQKQENLDGRLSTMNTVLRKVWRRTSEWIRLLSLHLLPSWISASVSLCCGKVHLGLCQNTIEPFCCDTFNKELSSMSATLWGRCTQTNVVMTWPHMRKHLFFTSALSNAVLHAHTLLLLLGEASDSDLSLLQCTNQRQK